MALTLVLVRHGRAERLTRGMTDMQRALTDEGRRAISRSFLRTFRLLGTVRSDDFELWCSPATRTRQTADEVKIALGPADSQVKDFLLEQTDDNFEAFLAALDARVTERPSGVLVCVGHAPFVDRAAKYLTGADFGKGALKFGYGACCAIGIANEVRSSAYAPGDLLWFVQGK